MGTEASGWSEEDDILGNDTSKPTIEPMYELFQTESLMSSNDSITELPEIRKKLEEEITNQRNRALNEARRSTVPTIKEIISEQLPGIVLHASRGNSVHLMPVLFYKKGATDALETLNISNAEKPPTYNKIAETFITKETKDRLKNLYSMDKGEKQKLVHIISSYVVDLDQYLNSNKDVEVAIGMVAKAILAEWHNAVLNFTICAIANKDVSSMPNPFRDSKLFGADRQALARIDVPPYPLFLGGRPVPYNLMVKLATAPKGNVYSQNFNSVKTVATTYLNVQLDVLSPNQYQHAISSRLDNTSKGPLIPVISLGRTIPGEQFQHNDSILSSLLGVYSMVAVNNPIFFTEPLRQKQVGSRGSLINLAKIAYEVSGIVPANNNDVLTSKTLLQPQGMKFMRQYISPRAAFALDLPLYIENPANAEFWWCLLTSKAGTQSTYYKAFIMMMDTLSNGRMSQLVKDYKRAKEQGHATDDIWVPGEPILTQTDALIPVGTGVVNNQIFNLEEVGPMMLRDPVCYGDNEASARAMMNLINGRCGKDVKVRQYEIKILLEGLFSSGVDVTGWKSRWIFNSKFLNTWSKAMSGAGNVTVTSNRSTQPWELHAGNPYLLMVTDATIANNAGAGAGYMGYTTGNWL